MSTYTFDTPAGVRDFKQPASYQKWSDWISAQNSANIKSNVGPCDPSAGVEDRYKIQSQYYNPAVTTVTNTSNAVIPWNGFPRRISSQYPPQSPQMYQDAESPLLVKDSTFLQHYFDNWEAYGNTLMRVQDEYLEWFSTVTNGKLTKVEFTCEGPEYWDNMYTWEPQTLLGLYQQYVSKDVQLEDLEWVDPGLGTKTYNPYNKWNTTAGILHLNCPPNSLGAEINLAAYATVLHGSNGVRINQPIPLIKCAQYGNPTRNSDPTIGYQVNTLCAQGAMVTCTNPVGLYIQEIDQSSWTRNGVTIPPTELSQIVTVVRGYLPTKQSEPGRALRVVITVPSSLGYTLSDISVNNLPAQYGGQFAECITMSLSGTAGGGPVSVQPLQPCLGDVCPTGFQAAAHAPIPAHTTATAIHPEAVSHDAHATHSHHHHHHAHQLDIHTILCNTKKEHRHR